jgi:phosphoglycolate phosphatase
MTLRAAIFDLDGTLLDTIEDLTDSMNAALASLGFPVRTICECKNLVGDGLHTFIQRALPEENRGNPEIAARLGTAMRAEYRARNTFKTKPYPGVREMLEALRMRGIPLSILSNKPHPSTVEVVERYFPGFPFRGVYGAREDVPVKPDPAGALEIIRALAIPPAEFLYLGDTNTDMQTARAAGAFAVGALWGFRTADELLQNGAQALAERPEDILDYF